ncbi:hypothetical protein NQ315_011948 [Exocentrus adspersus]|uniref:Cullin family profile domain-containing protein n=1 Tax=Exocentrus adspersus TaxID=1586481 RepID=A0AAV8W2B4_9CUCU|nr:hypothetical protein NQ315_011948 [Exocentrus adspersus]
MVNLPSPRKVYIKNFRGASETQVYAENAIRTLEDNLIAILDSKQRGSALQELYRIVENLHNTHRNVLYEKLHDILDQALQQKLDGLLNNTEDLLTITNYLWTEFCKQINIIKNVFLNCDRSANNGNKFNTVQNLSINLFKTIIVLNPTIKKGVTRKILDSIHLERKGDKVDIHLMKSILGMLTELQVYDDIFQVEFLRVSHQFYADEGNVLITTIDVREYLKHTQTRIKEEQERSKNYLNRYTSAAVLEIVYKSLIKDHLIVILDKAFELLFENQIGEELGILYNLVKKVTLGIKSLSDYFIQYILKRGVLIVTRPDNEKTMIQELLDFKDNLDEIVEKCFKNNDIFNGNIRNCFIKFINNKQNRPAQLLAKYIDAKLRCKDLSDEALEKTLSKVMVLFRYIQGKDIFEAFYKKDLAKRLLLGKSTSQDAEDSMIGKLKSECGAAFTSKIEGMFKDIDISQGMNNAFKQHLNHYTSTSPTDLAINVLTSSFWPNYPMYDVNLPAELVNYQMSFQKFYTTNHSGRKLVWQPNLGHCIVKAVFECGNKELQVSLFQTIVLLLFNKSNQLPFNEIQELTNMETEELKRTLISLACGKSRVLVKQPKGNKDAETDDVFSFNGKFSDKLFRVKINQVQLKETVEEEQATEKSVLADRQFQIDAAIVRILKNKKRVNHNELISELFNALDIPAKPYDLKKRIELLIEREYLERDKDDPSYYTYIA